MTASSIVPLWSCCGSHASTETVMSASGQVRTSTDHQRQGQQMLERRFAVTDGRSLSEKPSMKQGPANVGLAAIAAKDDPGVRREFEDHQHILMMPTAEAGRGPELAGHPVARGRRDPG
jgi:hypothetical protein